MHFMRYLCGAGQSSARALGLTFVGRGFEVRLAAPLNRSLAEGLQQVAEQCVRHCPTSALTFEEEGRNAIKYKA